MKPQGETFNVSRLSEISGMDRRTVKSLMRSVPPMAGSATNPEWTLAALEEAGRKLVEKRGASTALKDQKLAEEIRKLRHVNDSNAGLVVEKSAVCAAFTRGKNKLQEFRTELETKWPAKLAGLPDVAAAREQCRHVADRIYEVFRGMAVEFGALDSPENADREEKAK